MLIGGVVEVNVLGRTVVATSVLALAVGCAGQGSEPSGPEQAQRSAGQSISEPSTAAQAPSQSSLPAARSDESHVHGYDKTVPLTAGSPAAVAFEADLPGVFEVETHDSELLLFQLVVRG